MPSPGSITPVTAFAILLASGILVAVLDDWRLALIGAVGQYVAVAALLSATLPQTTAWAYVVVGALAALILLLGKRAQRERTDRPGWTMPVGTAAFRFVALMLVLLVAVIAAVRWPLPSVNQATTLACYVLAALFVAQAVVFEQPMRVGMGVLSLLHAVNLYQQQARVDLSLVLWAAAAHLCVALAAGLLQFLWRRPDGLEGEA